MQNCIFCSNANFALISIKELVNVANSTDCGSLRGPLCFKKVSLQYSDHPACSLAQYVVAKLNNNSLQYNLERSTRSFYFEIGPYFTYIKDRICCA